MSPPLPAFNQDGLLPPGDYAPTRADFEARFVKVLSGTREGIYEGWNRHRADLMQKAWLQTPDSS